MENDAKLFRTALRGCLMSLSGPSPPVFSGAVLRMMFQYGGNFSEKLLNEKLPELDPDARREIIVAMTTAFHEGVRVGVEFAKLGGSPPYQEQ